MVKPTELWTSPCPYEWNHVLTKFLGRKPLTNQSKHPSRRSVRLKEFDYSQPGGYFITIVTINRESLFGSIKGDQVNLSDLGRIVDYEWQRLEKRFRFIQLGAWVVMPNHFHGIIHIIETESSWRKVENGVHPAALEHFGSPVSGSIATIVRSFKSSVTQRYQWATQSSTPKVWQRGFYDHIIRSEEDYGNIHDYIVNNPIKWSEDENFINQA